MKKLSLPRLFRKFLRIVLTLLTALIISTMLIQDDPWLRQRCQVAINDLMSQWYNCHFHANLGRLDLLNGCVELRDIVVSCPDRCAQQAWHWQARTATLTWSWLPLLRGKKSTVLCVVDKLDCTSQFKRNGNAIDLAIMPHLILLTAPPELDVPFELTDFGLRDGLLHLYDRDDEYTGHIAVSGETSFTADTLRANVRLERGMLLKNDAAIVQDIAGKSSWYVPFLYHPKKVTRGTIDASCTVPALPAAYATYALHGVIEGSEGTCTISNQDTSLQCRCQFNKEHGFTGELTVPFVQGKQAMGTWTFSPSTTTGNVSFSQLELPGFLKNLVGHVQATLTPEQAAVDLNAGPHACTVVFGFFPSPWIKKIEYQHDNKKLLTCAGDPQAFKGMVPSTLLHALAQQSGYDFQGEGDLHYTGMILPTGLQLQIKLQNAHIRIPQTYGVIQKGSGTLRADYTKNKLQLIDGQLELYKGTLRCSRGTMLFDSSGALTYAHLPLLAHKCFFGWKKDFFAQISGACAVSMHPQGTSHIVGALTIDQAHVRGNLLSADFQNEFFGAAMSSLGSSVPTIGQTVDMHPWACDLSYTTQSPLEIKTPFLEAAVVCSGHVGGTLQNPEITGSFEFVRGTLAFPYKPLFITKGTVTVRPEALHDPFIHLVARNHVKKYDVELLITGSARDPKITFTSSPHLEQAQIITLLLGGSEDGSLYFLMPKVITNTLETLLFGSAETTSRVQKYLKTLFKPLKNVSITPRLSDQAGRGGMRGAIELEVNDRLRAIIAKNISLPEDTTFEIEYDVSDDSSFRVMRDERGDLGIEGEVRWKF